jgi:hypothetical protein
MLAAPLNRRLLALALAPVLAGSLAFGISGAAAKKTHHKAPPKGPSLAALQRLECAKFSCDATHQVLQLKVLTRGASRHGTGVSSQRGGDDVPRNVLIFPLLLSYDETSQQGYFTGGGFDPLVWHTYTQTTHWREKDNVTRDGGGAWVLRFQGSSSTCEPMTTACPASTGGGA